MKFLNKRSSGPQPQKSKAGTDNSPDMAKRSQKQDSGVRQEQSKRQTEGESREQPHSMRSSVADVAEGGEQRDQAVYTDEAGGGWGEEDELRESYTQNASSDEDEAGNSTVPSPSFASGKASLRERSHNKRSSKRASRNAINQSASLQSGRSSVQTERTSVLSEEDEINRTSEPELRHMHEAACRHLRNGHFEQALKKFEEILAILLDRYGETHHRVGAALHNVGIVHLRAGNLDDAMDAMEEAVRIRKITLGEYHSKVADSLVELGIILLSQKEYEDSLEIFNEALEMREREAEKQVPESDQKKINLSIAKILNNIGCVYFEYGDLKDAKETYDEALELQRSTLGDSSPSSEPGFLAMASTLCNLGYVYLEKHKFSDAAVILDEALQIQQSILEEDNKLVLNTLDNLGFAHAKDENYDAALKTYGEILEAQKESLGEKHIECSETLRKLVFIHLKLFQYEKALERLLIVEEIQEEQLGEDSKKLEKTRELISSVNYQLLKFPTAQEVVKKTLTKSLRNPFTNRLLDLACLGSSADEDVDIPYALKRPQNSSKMSGHKVTYA